MSAAVNFAVKAAILWALIFERHRFADGGWDDSEDGSGISSRMIPSGDTTRMIPRIGGTSAVSSADTSG